MRRARRGWTAPENEELEQTNDSATQRSRSPPAYRLHLPVAYRH
jgi:hypothetical protein